MALGDAEPGSDVQSGGGGAVLGGHLQSLWAGITTLLGWAAALPCLQLPHPRRAPLPRPCRRLLPQSFHQSSFLLTVASSREERKAENCLRSDLSAARPHHQATFQAQQHRPSPLPDRFQQPQPSGAWTQLLCPSQLLSKQQRKHSMAGSCSPSLFFLPLLFLCTRGWVGCWMAAGQLAAGVSTTPGTDCSWQSCTDSIPKLRTERLGKPIQKLYYLALFSPGWLRVPTISTVPGEKGGAAPANQSPENEKG